MGLAVGGGSVPFHDSSIVRIGIIRWRDIKALMDECFPDESKVGVFPGVSRLSVNSVDVEPCKPPSYAQPGVEYAKVTIEYKSESIETESNSNQKG